MEQRRYVMKTAIWNVLVAASCLFLMASPVSAQLDPNPNGFPAGEHFNVNIISKKLEYHCSLDVDDSGLPVYGNVVFVPEGQEVQIKMESGKIKGKKLSDMGDTLRVIDPCAGFADDTTSDEAAILQLPPHNAGYSVYARMVGTPSGDMTVEPGLDYLQDDQGNYLWWYAGDVGQGFSCGDQTIDKHEKGSRGKGNTGQSTAKEITCLFEWSGEVCYFDPDYSGQSYCGECLAWDELDPQVCIDYADCSHRNLCCEECCETLDDICCGTAGACVASGVCIDDLLTYYGGCELPVSLDPLTCAIGDPIETWCKVYDTPTWIFNVADFVQYFWDATNNGKVVQVRFYKR